MYICGAATTEKYLPQLTGLGFDGDGVVGGRGLREGKGVEE